MTDEINEEEIKINSEGQAEQQQYNDEPIHQWQQQSLLMKGSSSNKERREFVEVGQN